jgi:hypothetical protein
MNLVKDRVTDDVWAYATAHRAWSLQNRAPFTAPSVEAEGAKRAKRFLNRRDFKGAELVLFIQLYLLKRHLILCFDQLDVLFT